ncbi:UNVERIFIED_CONTAM: DNA-binding transcriptional MerR regulator [Streptomyces canus]
MVQPCPRGKVKWDDGWVITIGQLARYVGVSIKTIRVYHDKGLLPEPDRDASGYRRYGANDAIELVKIRTLAEAGVPLARIRALRSATHEEFQQALQEMLVRVGEAGHRDSGTPGDQPGQPTYVAVGGVEPPHSLVAGHP